MKKVIIFAIVVLICSAVSPIHLSAKGDKIKHFGISILFGAADILGSFCGALLSNVVNNKIQVKVHLNKKNRMWTLSLSYVF
jgi:hypothetical protein